MVPEERSPACHGLPQDPTHAQYNILMEYAYDAEITLRFHYASLC